VRPIDDPSAAQVLRNLEVKARYPNLAAAKRYTRQLGAREAGTSRDVDTYFRIPEGRLKLRQSEGATHGTLIFYRRPDAPVSRLSEYHLSRVDEVPSLRSLLEAAFGVLVTVSKNRQLFLYGATRIHLDDVAELGSFIELETVLLGQDAVQAEAEHELVKRALRLDEQQAVSGSYSDLLLHGAAE
jgi:adenylate cyclase class 2